MRLAYCIHALNLSGGIERVLTTKANYLADVMGYEIHIITARQKGRKEFFPLSGKIIRHDLDANDRMFLIKYRKRLDALLAKIRPDITVTVCDNSLYALTRCTDGSVKIGEFHFSHEKFLMKYGTNAIGKLYASFRTRKLENAVRKLDRFVVLTKADKNDWRKVTPEVEQIYNPLPFVSDEVSPLDEKRCIAAGRLESQKNFKDLITAWKTVDARHPDWKLSVYGDGSQKESLQDQIDSMGLKGKVTLKGRTNDVRKELLGSSCLVMSSRFEGFPMILLEALATGLPIVSYDCPKRAFGNCHHRRERLPCESWRHRHACTGNMQRHSQRRAAEKVRGGIKKALGELLSGKDDGEMGRFVQKRPETVNLTSRKLTSLEEPRQRNPTGCGVPKHKPRP